MVTTDGKQRHTTGTLPSAPHREPPDQIVLPGEEKTAERPRWWLFALFLLPLLIPVGVFLGWLLLRDDTETAATQAVEPEYLVDSPAVLYVYSPGPARFVGEDVNLDPDLASMQGEFDVDTAFLAPLALPADAGFVGGDATLDPDFAWMQTELEGDTAFIAVLTIPRSMPHFVGADGAFDADIGWMQTEYDIDTVLVPISSELTGPGWIGEDLGLD
jgi:hypothetical protein